MTVVNVIQINVHVVACGLSIIDQIEQICLFYRILDRRSQVERGPP